MRRECCISRPIIRIYLAIILLLCLNIQLNGQSCLPHNLTERISELKVENRFDEALILVDLQLDSLKSKQDLKPVIEAKLLRADLLRMKGHNRLAADLIDSLLSSNLPILSANSTLLAQLYTIRGTLYLTQGELKKGRTAIEKAIGIYSTSLGKEDTLLAPCYNKLGNYYYFNKIYDSAMAFYSRALELAEKKSRNMEDRASYIQNIGIIHLEQGDFARAEECFLESLRLKESIYSANSFSLGRIYLNIGRFYQGISDLDKSLNYIEKAENIFSTDILPVPFELGSIYWNKGLIYFLAGDYEMAITYLFNAQQIIDTVFSENRQLLSALNADIGNVYHLTGENEKAIFYYRLSLDSDSNTINIKTIRNLATLYSQEGNLERAKDYYKLVMDITGEDGKIYNPENALTFLYYGELLLKMGNDSVLFYLNRAIEGFSRNQGFQSRDIAASYYSIGEYYIKNEQFYQALKYYQKSLIAISNSAVDTNILANPPIQSLSTDNLIIKLLSLKAYYLSKMFIQNGDRAYLVSSGQTYLLCLDIIDQTRMKYRAEDCQMILSNDVYKLYEQAIDHFILAYNYTKDIEWLHHAFKTSERGKSMALLTKFKEANAKKIGLIPEALGKAEKTIISNLNLYRNNIWEEERQSYPDINKLNYLRASQLKYEKRYDSLIDHLEQNYPDYYKLKYDHTVVSVNKLQKILDNNEVVIEYTVAGDLLYLFLVSADDFEVKKISIDSTLIQDIFTLRKNLDFRHVAEYCYQDYMNYQRIAYKLYLTLIQPVEDYIEGKKLIIIPDEELSYLSFESLIQKIIPSDTIEFRHLPYLIKTCPVSYAASSTILSLIKKGHAPVLTQGVLALAPSSSVFTRSFLAENKALAQQLNLKAELPGATWEAETILKIMQGKKLIGDEATESEFKKYASSYDILHFATHTRIDDENPLSSILSFYPYDNNGEDGLLHTYEIYNLDLNGELAVLSACSTGDGKLQKGEGVISLARAFTYAGMPSVVMTLWDVEDISSGNIIPSFYHLLGKGVDKDVALQMAKLNYLKKTIPEIETHPAFWSGFVLYGNNRGFRQPTYEIYFILLFISGSLIIFISFVLIRRYITFRKNIKRIIIDIPNKFQSEDRI